MPAAQNAAKKAEATLREFALGFPEAYEDFPWGERVIKVKGKVFAFMGTSENGLSLGTKLPESNGAALMFPFAAPTHYGLGKSGWVTATFGAKEQPPVEILQAWIEESYRAVAPKKLVAQLTAPTAEPSGTVRTAKKKKKTTTAARPAAARSRSQPRRKRI